MVFKNVTFLIALGLVCNTVNAQIIYTDINPDKTSTVSNPPGFEYFIASIDFDGDNSDEYNFSWDDVGAGVWFLRMVHNAHELNLNGTLTNPFGARYIDPLTLGTAINSSSNWGVSTPKSMVGDHSNVNFQGLGERYVGCKFNLGTNTHYGWIITEP